MTGGSFLFDDTTRVFRESFSRVRTVRTTDHESTTTPSHGLIIVLRSLKVTGSSVQQSPVAVKFGIPVVIRNGVREMIDRFVEFLQIRTDHPPIEKGRRAVVPMVAGRDRRFRVAEVATRRKVSQGVVVATELFVAQAPHEARRDDGRRGMPVLLFDGFGESFQRRFVLFAHKITQTDRDVRVGALIGVHVGE